MYLDIYKNLVIKKEISAGIICKTDSYSIFPYLSWRHNIEPLILAG